MWKTYFTSDTHFGIDAYSILKREMRLFDTPLEYINTQIKVWNMQVHESDTIYHLGDFCNYNKDEIEWDSGLKIVKWVNAKVVLIIGNNEQRVVTEKFNNDFAKFEEYCKGIGFKGVYKSLDLTEAEGIKLGNIDKNVYLVHSPADCRDDCLNLFGHTHRAGGLYRKYGLNVGTDLNHFQLYSREDLDYLLSEKEQYWDNDGALNKF